MTFAKFEHVKISALIGVVPPKIVDIDDEIEFYKNDKKLLERNKKILSLGKRHIIDEGTTLSDLCESAAINLINKYKIDKEKIESLVVVSTSHDYIYPATSCIIHGRLELSEYCLCYDFSGLACSAYVHALLNVFSLIENKVVKNCLLLCGDLASTHSNVKNRKVNMLFGDAGTATFIEYCENENKSYFYTGTRGKGWDKIIAPASLAAMPIRNDIAGLEIKNQDNDIWHLWEEIIQGMDVFKFTMDVGPKSISKLLAFSGKNIEDIDYFAIHQANGQIVKTVADRSKIPNDKYSTETFKKYANCSAASVTTVLLDQCKDKKNVFICTFGVGLSFASAIIDFEKARNFGLQVYEPLRKNMTRKEQISYWTKQFKG